MASEQTSFRRYGRFYRNVSKYAGQEKVLVSAYLILSLFTISFFAAVFIRPTAITIAKIWREIQDKKQVNIKLDTKISALEEAQSIYTSIESDLTVVDKAMPKNSDYLRLAQELEYLASINEVDYIFSDFGSVTVYPKEAVDETASSIGEHLLSLSFQGSLPKLQALILDLENFDRFLSVQSLTLTPLGGVNNSGDFELSVTIESTVYSFPEGLDLGT